MFDWLLALLPAAQPALPPQKDYVGVLAAETAYVSMAAEKPEEKPLIDTKDCKRCNGLGKIRTGDDINWTDCPDCEPKTEAGDMTPATTAPSMRLQAQPLPPVPTSR
jgi:ribosomal protein L37AE/L43A